MLLWNRDRFFLNFRKYLGVFCDTPTFLILFVAMVALELIKENFLYFRSLYIIYQNKIVPLRRI